MAPAEGAVAVLLVDLGGLACRFRPEERLHALARAAGLAEAEVYARIWDSGLDARMDRGDLSVSGAHHAVCDALGVELSLDEVCRLWALAFTPDREVLGLVDIARTRARAALLTDNGPFLRHGLARWLPEVHRCFDPRLFSCEIQAVKPAPQCFARALALLGSRADRTLLVDDSARNVEGARETGLRAERCASARVGAV